jgi:hypothetical protein
MEPEWGVWEIQSNFTKKNRRHLIVVLEIVYNLHISLSELSMWNVSDCCKDETEVK